MKVYSKIENHILRDAKIEYYKQIANAARFKPIDEQNVYIPDQYCKTFGCGKRLTLMEKLCGCRCIDHMEIKMFEVFGNY